MFHSITISLGGLEDAPLQQAFDNFSSGEYAAQPNSLLIGQSNFSLAIR